MNYCQKETYLILWYIYLILYATHVQYMSYYIDSNSIPVMCVVVIGYMQSLR